MKEIKDTIQKLRQRFILNKARYKQSEFINAVTSGDDDKVEALVKKNGKLIFNPSLNWDVHPLYLICRDGTEKMTEFFFNSPELLQMTHINKRDNSGKTIVHYLCSWAINKYAEKMSILLEIQDVNINIKDADGNTPLLCLSRYVYAGTEENAVLAKMLIEHGADLSIPCSMGRTLLFYCVTEEKKELTRLVIKNSVDLLKKNKYGIEPFQEALKKGNQDIIELFLAEEKHFDYFKNMVQNYNCSHSNCPENIHKLQAKFKLETDLRQKPTSLKINKL